MFHRQLAFCFWLCLSALGLHAQTNDGLFLQLIDLGDGIHYGVIHGTMSAKTGFVPNGNGVGRASYAGTPFTQDMLLPGGALAGRIVMPSNLSPATLAQWGVDMTGMRQITEVAHLSVIGFTDPEAKPVNMSVRMVADGKSPLILGFIIGDGAPRRVLIRAVGPGLKQFGVTGTMPNPKLDLFQGQVVRQSNLDYESGLSASFALVNAFALDPHDAAIMAVLPPGPYTVQVLDEGGMGGDVLVEVYQMPEQ
jgi:hypothetical protein